MRLEYKGLSPYPNSVEPALQFNFEARYDGFEALLSVEGVLLAADEKVLAPILTAIPGTRESSQLVGSIAARGSIKDNRIREGKGHLLSLWAPISQRALDYIEELRSKDPRREAKMKLRLTLRVVTSAAEVCHLNEIGPAGHPFESLRSEGLSLVTYKYNPNYSSERGNLWVISGRDSPVFLEFREFYQEIPVTIPSSNWMLDFAPYLGLGRFMVVELSLPRLEDIPKDAPSDFAERLSEAINALSEMEEKIKEGDWNEVGEKARPVIELLRDKDTICSILTKYGYPSEVAELFFKVLKKFFEYASKFHHKVDRDGRRLLPEIKAEKEDAYSIYYFSVGLVNVIVQKLRKT
jgi:hypothetical protein